MSLVGVLQVCGYGLLNQTDVQSVHELYIWRPGQQRQIELLIAVGMEMPSEKAVIKSCLAREMASWVALGAAPGGYGDD